MTNSRVVRVMLSAVVLIGTVVALTGCPPPPASNTKLTVLFTGDASAAVKAILQGGTIPVDDIEALYIDIVKVVLDHSPGSGGDGGQADGDGEGSGNESKITVFPQEGGPTTLRINVKELIEISRILSEVEVPSGKYTKIRLTIENPELFLVGDETSFTNIGLSANSRLFISEMFELPAGESSLIVLDFGGVKINQLGNGDFQLTPQLAVDVSVESANVALSGEVVAVSETSLTVMTEEQGAVTVIVTVETTVEDSNGNVLGILDVPVGDDVTVNAGITVDDRTHRQGITRTLIACETS